MILIEKVSFQPEHAHRSYKKHLHPSHKKYLHAFSRTSEPDLEVDVNLRIFKKGLTNDPK